MFTECRKDSDANSTRCLGSEKCSAPYAGRLCQRCASGYYPWFGRCTKCPDDFGWTVHNTLTVIYRYGIIWLLWVIINRFLCEELHMADSLLNSAQIAGVLGGFEVNWPVHLATFLGACGILDFDIDVTGPGCVVSWTWGHDMVLQLSLPLMVGLINVLHYWVRAVCYPAQDPLMDKLSRATIIQKYLGNEIRPNK